jgi:hypothetical protein
MHIALLTVLIVAGAGQPAYGPADPPGAVAAETSGGPGCAACQSGGCEDGECAGAGADCKHPVRKWVADWFGPMPQTCYQPRFGCYPGNGRDINRYPAFHGYYYRAPYNYRHYFDYPWHAMPNEPRGYFSGPVGAVEGAPAPAPAPGALTPTPAPQPVAPIPADSSAARVPNGEPRLLRQ